MPFLLYAVSRIYDGIYDFCNIGFVYKMILFHRKSYFSSVRDNFWWKHWSVALYHLTDLGRCYDESVRRLRFMKLQNCHNICLEQKSESVSKNLVERLCSIVPSTHTMRGMKNDLLLNWHIQFSSTEVFDIQMSIPRLQQILNDLLRGTAYTCGVI